VLRNRIIYEEAFRKLMSSNKIFLFCSSQSIIIFFFWMSNLRDSWL